MWEVIFFIVNLHIFILHSKYVFFLNVNNVKHVIKNAYCYLVSIHLQVIKNDVH